MPEEPKGYVIVTERITDPEGMAAYSRLAGPTLAEAGARPLAVGEAEVIEGDWHGERTVLLEFESVAAARAWYESESYGQAKPLRWAAAESNAVILGGLPAQA
ncbi:protein of unknown function DUF1330 [Actinobacteria bacterium OK074]|nr:protein of unknown function DUF1330 [Actinobacteria bacterium OK074]